MSERKWVAIDALAKKRGETLYFHKFTGFGPAFTADPRKAQEYDSEREASLAVIHPMIFIEAAPSPIGIQEPTP